MRAGRKACQQVSVCCMLALIVLYGCRDEVAVHADRAVFIDATIATGLDYVHVNGMTGQYYFSEMMGPGVALFDYDNDGDLDIYLGQGHRLEADRSAPAAVTAPDEKPPLRDRLYRNDLLIDAAGKRTVRFTDVTAASGLDAQGYSMGVVTGDIDNDGWNDLYITNFGSNQLWHNQGDGTFRNITERSKTDDPRWSTSAALLDYDRDGWLDLYIVNYTDFRLDKHKACFSETGTVEYCGPRSYQPEPDRLLRNRGDGTFADVTADAGLLLPGPGLGVVSADFDQDGWLDLYVANDQTHNHLWINNGPAGGFRNESLLRGSAVDSHGRPEASMGVDAGDIDNDGDPDLFMTHLLNETNTLYLNDGSGSFADMTGAIGLASPSIGFTGFGTALLDYDNDGWLDLIAVNGEVRMIREQQAAGELLPLKQPNQLFHNEQGKFSDASALAPVLAQADVSRGAAVGDIDNDGDPDVLITNNNGRAQLLLNQVGAAAHWLGLRLLGQTGRDMLGTRVALYRDGAPTLWRRVRTDASYISANDPRLLFGLGRTLTALRVEVHWLSGRREYWEDLPADQYHTLVEGQGQTIDPARQ